MLQLGLVNPAVGLKPCPYTANPCSCSLLCEVRSHWLALLLLLCFHCRCCHASLQHCTEEEGWQALQDARAAIRAWILDGFEKRIAAGKAQPLTPEEKEEHVEHIYQDMMNKQVGTFHSLYFTCFLAACVWPSDQHSLSVGAVAPAVAAVFLLLARHGRPAAPCCCFCLTEAGHVLEAG